MSYSRSYAAGEAAETVMSNGEGGDTRPVPYILEETNSGYMSISLDARHRTDRKIFLNGEVCNGMADNFLSEMLYLSGSNEPIDIYINSPGGSVDAGLMIYDVIRGCEGKIPINMYCTGMAASMAAVILAGGQKGRRFILPNSRCMIHEPLINGGVGGSATSIKKTADSILETKAKLAKILSKHTGKSVAEINKATSFDNFMSAEEAVKFGICDEVRNVV